MVRSLDLSESRSTHAVSAVQRTDWTLQGQWGEEERGQRPLCWVAAGALFVPAAALAHLSVNSPSMLLAAAFLCWLWAEEVPKITRRALPLVGHSLWWPQDRLACSLQAPGSSGPYSDFLWPPPPQSPSGALPFPFIALLRVSPGGRTPLWA